MAIPEIQAPSAVAASQGISQIINMVLMFLIIASLLFVIIKFGSYRIFVEKLIRVKGGYVSKGGRYRLKVDNKTGMEYLQPMFGAERLPNFPAQSFQKVKGMPIIGIKREISLIQLSEYQHLVSLPTYDDADEGQSFTFNTLNWIFLEQRRRFLKQFQRERIMDILTVAAPLIIIVMGIFMIIFTIYMGVRADTQNAEMLKEALRIVSGAAGR